MGDFLEGLIEAPPHVWGRHKLDDLFYRVERNTPTCVGKPPTVRKGAFSIRLAYKAS